ncbi:SDR family NAD(P)-dependent oxidoreductase [Streptomyces uncialis]|uniref:SDR family NAD(P)-dependent oxidoreductase n=1 Tax=Streptomyces uncialis TaxID=1048205 RepID=UPI0033F1E1AD
MTTRVLVTGGSRGIGAAVALRLAREGTAPACAARDHARPDRARSAGGAGPCGAHPRGPLFSAGSCTG